MRRYTPSEPPPPPLSSLSGLFYTGFDGIDAPRAVFRTIAFTLNGEVYTVDSSAELFCLKIRTLFLRTPCFAVFAAVRSLRQ